jgi:formate dehydrogenase subunit gamma
MLNATARAFAALILGAAFALPASAQDKSKAEMGKDINPPPITAPTKNAGPKPVEPASTVQAEKAGHPPVPIQGSTANPGWNVPPKFAPLSEERQYASVPGVDTNRLIQHEGRNWREFRNGPLTHWGGWLIGFVFLALMLFYFIKGSIKLHAPPTGRLIERFNGMERTAHWVMAISFVFMALTGTIMLWGKHIILPWLGYGGFSWLSIISKNIHNFVGPLFIFSLLVSFLIFVRDNLWRSYDFKWLASFGGMFSKQEIPSGRFNAGEKAWFWGGLTLLGVIVSISGLILDFPNWDQGRQVMQGAQMFHAIAAVCFIAASLGHAYLGTIGMEGAYQGMRKGYVDEEWAREHHLYWYEDVKQGKRSEKIVPVMHPAPGDD